MCITLGGPHRQKSVSLMAGVLHRNKTKTKTLNTLMTGTSGCAQAERMSVYMYMCVCIYIQHTCRVLAIYDSDDCVFYIFYKYVSTPSVCITHLDMSIVSQQ